MRQLTPAELAEPDSTVIIPVQTWDNLPKEVTDLLSGYIGQRVKPKGGTISCYKFDNVPGYLVRELEAVSKQLQRGTNQ
jgi:hypothetical protein